MEKFKKLTHCKFTTKLQNMKIVTLQGYYVDFEEEYNIGR